jgi:hypothetical protein
MPVLEAEPRLDGQVTLEAGFRILTGIEDVCAAAPACFKMQASRTVTGFAALAFYALISARNPDAPVIRVSEICDDLFVAKGTGLLADIIRAFNHRPWRNNHFFAGGTSNDRYESGHRENEF